MGEYFFPMGVNPFFFTSAPQNQASHGNSPILSNSTNKTAATGPFPQQNRTDSEGGMKIQEKQEKEMKDQFIGMPYIQPPYGALGSVYSCFLMF